MALATRCLRWSRCHRHLVRHELRSAKRDCPAHRCVWNFTSWNTWFAREFPEQFGSYREALISDCVALNKAPAEDGTQWTRGQCVARCACLLPTLRRDQITLLGDTGNMRERLVHGCTRQCSGWNWTRDLQRHNHTRHTVRKKSCLL